VDNTFPTSPQSTQLRYLPRKHHTELKNQLHAPLGTQLQKTNPFPLLKHPHPPPPPQRQELHQANFDFSRNFCQLPSRSTLKTVGDEATVVRIHMASDCAAVRLPCHHHERVLFRLLPALLRRDLYQHKMSHSTVHGPHDGRTSSFSLHAELGSSLGTVRMAVSTRSQFVRVTAGRRSASSTREQQRLGVWRNQHLACTPQLT